MPVIWNLLDNNMNVFVFSCGQESLLPVYYLPCAVSLLTYQMVTGACDSLGVCLIVCIMDVLFITVPEKCTVHCCLDYNCMPVLCLFLKNCYKFSYRMTFLAFLIEKKTQ